jgi:hypothetical protein
MNTRRDFLSVTVKGSAIAVATALLSRTASAASASDTNGSDSVDPGPVLGRTQGSESDRAKCASARLSAGIGLVIPPHTFNTKGVVL